MKQPLVGILMGSDSDLEIMMEAARTLDQFGVPYEVEITSAHRSPARTRRYASLAVKRGLKVLIIGAGSAAALAGVVAAETILPVIGVPIASSPLSGVDALHSTVQMPSGVPVATMAIGKAGATNAAILAVQILATGNNVELTNQLYDYKKMLANKVSAVSKAVQQRLRDSQTDGKVATTGAKVKARAATRRS
ncbi:MAG: 5-(carboxyamino)imidazole ribonucleotide mutase [Acidobacteriota bacterium]